MQLVCGTGQAAAAVPERSCEHRQAGHRTKQHRAVAMMLGADEGPQQGGLRHGVLARKSLDVVRRQAHRVRHALRRVLQHALRERLVADGVLRHVVVVHQAVANDDVHHRERQDGVGGWRDREVPVGRFGGPRPDRIHHHNLRAATLRLAYQRPVVEVRDDRIRPPQHDVPAVDDLLRIDSGPGPDGGREAGGSNRTADMAIEAAAPHRTEQPRVDGLLLNEPLYTCRAVREDRFSARFFGNRLPL